MGKSIVEAKGKDKDGETKILFKKSNNTIYTHSRTCSGASQSYTRSGVLQIKKHLENNHNYYVDRGKLKRDLSVETDVCKLRTYYKSKKNRMSNQGSSAKSRYSTLVDTEVETIEEFPDTSACGDNETTELKSNPTLDIASLMIDNLKDLLNQWIQKHLLENKDTKQKIDSVLNTLIQKLDDSKALASSSGSTYVLHKEAANQAVKNKKVATASLTCQYCKHKPKHFKAPSSSNSSQRDSSSITIPFQYKDIKIISTLSIPRSFHKRGIEEKPTQPNSWFKMKKIKHKNIILSIDKSNKLLESSSFDLVAISTKSLTRRCINYDNMDAKKKKRHIVFFPKPFYKSATDTSSTTNREHVNDDNIEMNKHQLDEMPSVVKSLYANDPLLISNIDKNIQFDTKNDNSTMTDKKSEIIDQKNNVIQQRIVVTDKANGTYVTNTPETIVHERVQSTTMAAFDFINQEIEFPNVDKLPVNETKLRAKSSNRKVFNGGKINKRRRFKNTMSPSFKARKYQTFHNKQFTFLYKKAKNKKAPSKEFVKHCHNLWQYFAHYEGTKNIKLDVCINVFPNCENATKDVYTHISNQAMYDINGGQTLLYNVHPTDIETPQIDEESLKDPIENDNSSCVYAPDIIPLLDGAVSQAKYIFNVTSQEKTDVESKPNSFVERSTLTSELEIVQEISELRAVIKDLAAAAEKFVSERLIKGSCKSNPETNVSHNVSNNFTSSSKCEAVINHRNPSKAIQYSKEFEQNQKFQSGLKITKEPKKEKKEIFDFYNRLAKKSTSYRIIDSESVLRVTDMTSKANDFQEYKYYTDEALTCSLPKSRSLFELTSEQKKKRKLIALYCDGYQNNRACCMEMYQQPTKYPSSTKFPSSSKCPSSTKCHKKWFNFGKKDKEAKPQPSSQVNVKTSCICKTGSRSNDSCSIPIDNAYYSSTVCFNPTSRDCYEDQTITTDGTRKRGKNRKGMGFGEGCVYCMLLWIPVLIIACLFYGYVLKDKVKFADGRKSPARTTLTLKPITGLNRNRSILYVKLSDLGF